MTSSPRRRDEERATRRRRGARPGLGARATAVLGALVPVVAVTAFLGVDASPQQEPGARSPQEVALTRATLTCPGVAGPVLVATAGESTGEVQVRQASAVSTVRVRPDGLSRVRRVATSGSRGDAGPVEVTGLDDLAPGLVAGRFPANGAPSGAECRPPAPETWFSGLGAAPRHSSVVELTNPDRGRAVVDVEVHDRRGVVDAPSLLGIAVPGRGAVSLDLAREVPRRGPLAVQVTSTRGRIGASVLDRFDDLGAGASGSDWSGGQDEPATELLLPGVPDGAEQRELVLTNTSGDETRAGVEVVTADSIFSPDDLEEVTVAAQGTRAVDLSDVLPSGSDAVGLRVTSSRPVAAVLRSTVGDDLALTAAAEPLSGATTVLLPPGAKRLVLIGTGGSGSAGVVPRAGDGSPLGDGRVQAELSSEAATVIDVPRRARRLDVRLRGSTAAAAVVVRGGEGGGQGDGAGDRTGAAVVRVHDLERAGLVGDVRPGLR